MSIHDEVHIGPYIIVETLESDVPVGGNVCSTGCRTKGRMAEYCSLCGTLIRFDPTITSRYKPSFWNLIDGCDQVDIFMNDLFYPAYIDGGHNGEDGISVLIPNGSDYSKRGGPVKMHGTYPMNCCTGLADKITEDFKVVNKEVLAYLLKNSMVKKVTVYYGVVEYAH